ncbi:MAG: hypothetical protein M3Y09_12600 [Actinomycetota bacterium]|nr:hypothetical protein [Actinomycetota bacterium]
MTQLSTEPIEVRRLDITKTNLAVQRLIERTENPRHRYILQAYDRHRNLEHAGRFEEIFEPHMTVERPVYRFSMFGQPTLTLEGREQVEPLYRHWSETNQTIFYNEDEQVAIGDGMVVSTSLGYQQVLGAELPFGAGEADADAMYLIRGRVAMIWPYDERCRLVGENVWEYDESRRGVVKLDPEDVLTTARAAELLDPYIKPLPPFDDSMLTA